MIRSLLVALVLVGGAVRAAHAQDGKMAWVDIERAVQETEDGRKAKTEIKKVFETKQKEIDERQTNLRKKIEELDKKRTLLPQDKLREQEASLQKELMEVQETFQRHQGDLQRRQQEAFGKIVDRMQRIIAKIAAAENLSMVFDRQQAGLIFAKPHLDMTNEVIRRYNAGEGAGSESTAQKKPAAPAAPKK